MSREQKYERLTSLINMANYYTRLYDMGNPIIEDQAWDKIYFEIQELEEELGIYPKNSPTQHIPYEIVNELKKVTHNHKMLSLQKTKDLEEVRLFAGDEEILAMLKMDGLTCSLTYQDGTLISAETRGNGSIGEDILHNVYQLKSVPKYLPNIKGKLVVDGEVVCTYPNFEMFASEYKNPRNFAAGSIRLLDSNECAKRKLTFVAWDVIEGLTPHTQLSRKLTALYREGFNTVPYIKLPAYDADEHEVPYDVVIDQLKGEAEHMGFPIDGAVFKFDDIAYGKSLGETSHHFKNAIAYKFYDETYPTRLFNIEWTMGRTGILTPVAVFEPIDIDGSTVERANLHNLTVLKNTLHGNGWQGQKIEVFKANMIIPQIASAEEDTDATFVEYFDYPHTCPICGSHTVIKQDNDSAFVMCDNDACEGKLINRLDHFCGKKGLDIKGLSKATLDKLIDWGWVNSIIHLFDLRCYRDEWIKKPGFGEKSVDKILNAIDNSSHCDWHQFICALGIPLIGSSASKELAKHFSSYENFRTAIDIGIQFWSFDNFGYEMHSAIINFNYKEADEMVKQGIITFNSITEETNQEKTLDGLTFVITGKLSHFKNRDAIKEKIESLGGKVTGSVSKNTSYLINNDKDSTSSKNKSAKSLGIPILSEEDFIQTFGIE